MKQKIIILLSILSINTTLFAQFQVQGVIRPRFEFRNGYGTLRNDTTTPAVFVSQRSRLSFLYEKDNLQTKFTLFDYRVWGDQVWKKDVPSMGVHELWAKYKLNDKFSIKFGRQELKYDNSRLISSVNWNQIGAAHDALLLKYLNNDWSANLVVAWNQSSENKFGTDYEYATSYYKSLNIFWLQKKFNNLTVSSLSILDGMQDLIDAEKIRFRFTSGLKFNYKNNDFQFIARVFLQTGELQNTQNINAFYTNLELSYKTSDKLKLYVGNEIKSGNDATDVNNTESNAFDILYGARHKLNGRIGYFSTPSTTKGAGLIDTYLKGTYKFAKNTSLLTEYHYFALQNNYIENNVVINKFLAHEIDFVFDRKVSESVKLQAGYSMIFGEESLEIIKDGNADLFNNWFYFMVTINPTFFNSANK